MIQYVSYHMTKKELLLCYLQSMFIIIIIGELFYKSLWAVLILLPYIYQYSRQYKKNKLNQIKKEMTLEFRDGILDIAAALNTGYSIENAINESIKDLIIIHGQNSLIVKEFKQILNQLHSNQTVEQAFFELGKRSGIKEIQSFADVFIIAKRTGGDLIKIIQSSAKNIGEKIELEREITTMIAAKQFESKIMNLIPLGIIIYLSFFSPEFMKPLYHNLSGIIFMSVMLFLYNVAIWLSKKITTIEF